LQVVKTENTTEMKHKLKLSAIAGLFLLNACSSDSEDLMGNWIKRSDFEGLARGSAVTFTIGDKAYVGTGYDGDDRLKDFWEYDSDLDFWKQKADLPGAGRSAAVAFAAGDKGYVGTGYDGDDELSDFWEYDPSANTWQRKADFAGGARYDAVAFGIGDKGYIGTGYDGNDLKDFWEYDPATDQWNQIVSIGGSKRRGAVAFVMNDEAYVLTGKNNGVYLEDFYKFNPTEGTWTKLKDLDEDDEEDLLRANAVAFTMEGKAYLTAGTYGYLKVDTWEYHPSSDTWVEKTEFEGSAREDAVAFTLNNKGYVVTGRAVETRFDDIWELNPNMEEDEDD
jgi:N-acetylneuraminic acid mutarotase